MGNFAYKNEFKSLDCVTIATSKVSSFDLYKMI